MANIKRMKQKVYVKNSASLTFIDRQIVVIFKGNTIPDDI